MSPPPTMLREHLSRGGGRRRGEREVMMMGRSAAAACVTCGLCGGFLRDATTVPECLHTFCRSCIYENFDDEERSCCPTCNIDLGCSPLTKLRADHILQSVREKLFPSKKRKIEEVTPQHPASVLPHSIRMHREKRPAKKTHVCLLGDPMSSNQLGKDMDFQTIHLHLVSSLAAESAIVQLQEDVEVEPLESSLENSRCQGVEILFGCTPGIKDEIKGTKGQSDRIIHFSTQTSVTNPTLCPETGASMVWGSPSHPRSVTSPRSRDVHPSTTISQKCGQLENKLMERKAEVNKMIKSFISQYGEAGAQKDEEVKRLKRELKKEKDYCNLYTEKYKKKILSAENAAKGLQLQLVQAKEELMKRDELNREITFENDHLKETVQRLSDELGRTKASKIAVEEDHKCTLLNCQNKFAELKDVVRICAKTNDEKDRLLEENKALLRSIEENKKITFDGISFIFGQLRNLTKRMKCSEILPLRDNPSTEELMEDTKIQLQNLMNHHLELANTIKSSMQNILPDMMVAYVGALYMKIRHFYGDSIDLAMFAPPLEFESVAAYKKKIQEISPFVDEYMKGLKFSVEVHDNLVL